VSSVHAHDDRSGAYEQRRTKSQRQGIFTEGDGWLSREMGG